MVSTRERGEVTRNNRILNHVDDTRVLVLGEDGQVLAGTGRKVAVFILHGEKEVLKMLKILGRW